MRQKISIIGILFLFCYLSFSNAFVTSKTKLSFTVDRNKKNFIRNKLATLKFSSNDDFSPRSKNEKVFILSFDGVVANTASIRASIAIDAALETWPFLQDYDIVSDRTWLMNKLQALLHVTQKSNEGILGCEAVILARLLIEEQQLDGGRSVGKTGKYASKFHPSVIEGSSHGISSQRAKNGSRPLTVGEIAANWVDGASLAETLFVKYNLEGKSPLPVIRENLSRLHENQAKLSPPSLIPDIARALENSDYKIYILVGHHSQTQMALSSLTSLSVPIKIYDSNIANDEIEQATNHITLVAPKDEYETQDDIINRLVLNAAKGSSIVVVQSFLQALIHAKRIMGDDSPRRIDGFSESAIGDDIRINLSLASWADNTDPQQHNDALMNPWLDVMNKSNFIDMLHPKLIRIS